MLYAVQSSSILEPDRLKSFWKFLYAVYNNIKQTHKQCSAYASLSS